jgi:hypothetical protein
LPAAKVAAMGLELAGSTGFYRWKPVYPVKIGLMKGVRAIGIDRLLPNSRTESSIFSAVYR